ncbi:MAG TPA: lytic murein transglycosylase B [Gammaproteobacteria bacterium]|jgi:membrane-bound lytic murein transglycosylase B|nr:lytic murein transglycosylase B [Gammaproteobacteria bacterium]
MLRLFIQIIILFISANTFVYADTAFTKRQDVQTFIKLMVKKYHFNQNDLIKIFDQVKFKAIVIQHVNQPLEANPWTTYQRLFVNEWRIKHGVKFWDKHAVTLKKAEETYGVPASIIVATLGVETKYGERTGDHRVIDALTSLGFSDNSRAPFFRKELEEFLLLTREQHLNPLKVTGSYAGAIGMPQFMPSSYRYYAASFNKTDSIDLMNNTGDVIASIANYYNKHGWQKNQPVAVPAAVNLSKYSSIPKVKSVKKGLTLKEMEKYGIKPKEQVADTRIKAKMIELQSNNNTEYWIGFQNFDVIKRYNPNDLYAMAVYQLSDDIKDLRNRK